MNVDDGTPSSEGSMRDLIRRKEAEERDPVAEALARKKLADDLMRRKPPERKVELRPGSVVRPRKKGPPGANSQRKETGEATKRSSGRASRGYGQDVSVSANDIARMNKELARLKINLARAERNGADLSGSDPKIVALRTQFAALCKETKEVAARLFGKDES